MLVRQGAVYHFRRRIPQSLRSMMGQGEIWHSLGTTSRRIAKARAASLYALSEEIFIRMEAGGMEALSTEEFWALADLGKQLQGTDDHPDVVLGRMADGVRDHASAARRQIPPVARNPPPRAAEGGFCQG
jgi:hypothetical protein